MKKFLCLCCLFLVSSFKVFGADIKFVQIDSLKYSPAQEEISDSFAKMITEINNLKDVDFVIFTGNNIAKSDEKLLKAFLKKANKLKAPYYIALGHKDLNKNKGLSKSEYIETVRRISHRNIKSPNYIFNKKGVLFIVADGAKEFVPTPFGYYRDNVIKYIDNMLAQNSDKNAVILQHFPINPPSDSESYRTYKAEEYTKILGEHKNVKAIVSGFGVNSESDLNGIKHITTAEYPQYRIIEIIDCKSPEPTIWTTLR